MTLTEVAPDHSTDLPATASHVTGALVPTTAACTIHLTADPHLTGTLPEMTADLEHRSRKPTLQTRLRFFIHFTGTILETQGQKTQTSHNC